MMALPHSSNPKNGMVGEEEGVRSTKGERDLGDKGARDCDGDSGAA